MIKKGKLNKSGKGPSSWPLDPPRFSLHATKDRHLLFVLRRLRQWADIWQSPNAILKHSNVRAACLLRGIRNEWDHSQRIRLGGANMDAAVAYQLCFSNSIFVFGILAAVLNAEGNVPLTRCYPSQPKAQECLQTTPCIVNSPKNTFLFRLSVKFRFGALAKEFYKNAYISIATSVCLYVNGRHPLK